MLDRVIGGNGEEESSELAEMRVVVIVVEAGPEERPYGAGAFNGSEREAHGAHHGGVGLMRQGDMMRCKCVLV
jgi:hypothetical protein